MKKALSRTKKIIVVYFLLSVAVVALFTSCSKTNDQGQDKQHASYYSSTVLDKWMTLQLRLVRNTTGVPNHGFARHFGYAGVAAIESIAPGMPGYSAWSSGWNGLTGLPAAGHAREYFLPANLNAAMAAISKAFFPNAGPVDKAAIDSLEQALVDEFLLTQPLTVIAQSAAFGKSVSTAVFNWSETDGYKNANNSYPVPAGPGLWKPTPPAFAPPATPYWGNNRSIVTGSLLNTQPPAPVTYSTEESSPFYQMVNEVYQVSQNLTDDQKAKALFWRDVPGVSSPGHWVSILQQVIRQTDSKLDKSVSAYALMGAAINDGLISCFQSKFHFNLVRPVTYIREVIGQTTWNSFLGTPAHPEYPSAHSNLSAAAASVLEEVYGDIGTFTDHTYDYLGFAPRTYATFMAIAEEAGQSRLYAGIHYTSSIQAGLVQGQKVAANIFSYKK